MATWYVDRTLKRERYVVGVDGGSQSTKVVIYDLDGNAVAEGRQALRPSSRPQPGIVEHPDDDLWDSLAAASRQALANFKGDPRDIVGVGLCTIRCCKAFLRADGSLARPVISWMDTRAYQPYVPDDPGVAYATTSSGYLTHRLTGEFRDTAANSIALQWPIDTDRWQWSEDAGLLRQFNLRREQLFELVMPGTVAGKITAQASAATGIPAGLPVVVTANDKAVEALGMGSLDERTALVSLGTYIAAMVHGERNRPDAQQFWTNFSCIPNRYLYESHGIRRGMWTLTWFMDLLGPEFAAAAAARGVSREQVLEEEARLVPAGSDGLVSVLDWLAPTDKPFRKGVMLGFDARHTRAHGYRSILEAIALTMKGARRRDGRRARDHAARDRPFGRRRTQRPLHAGVRGRVRHSGVPRARTGRREPRLRRVRRRRGRPAPGHRDRRGAHGKAPRDVPARCRERRRLPQARPRSLSRRPRLHRPGPRTVLADLPLRTATWP